MTLGIVYHMPFWRSSDGALFELEGSFARYVDSLAPYFDRVSLCVPLLAEPSGVGTQVRSSNVTVVPLPVFAGPREFYRRLPQILPRLVRWVRDVDVAHFRVPTPAGVFAFALARLFRRPAFLLVVGDLRGLLPSMRYHGLRRAAWRTYTAFEETGLQWMVNQTLTFANGAALTLKHTRPGRTIVETTTTTIGGDDIASRTDTCTSRPVRLLTVSRIDPRKGLRILPHVVRLLATDGIDATLHIVGPTVGRPGERERLEIVEAMSRYGVADRIFLTGPRPLDALLPTYADYDVFVLPTLPGEGIPRVLLEAMSGGVPVVASRVAGIPGLITHESNGLLVDDPTPAAFAAAVARVVGDGPLRRRLISRGYETARTLTLRAQSARMMEVVTRVLGVSTTRPVVLPV